ncbi:MAG: hypothetical protein EOP88_25110 [Verrucomicrobiaceae bacterium]|nr:MAG: hypothetical protein EOP88_25110 [Verrucomicrobiaceae bacterium]
MGTSLSVACGAVLALVVIPGIMLKTDWKDTSTLANLFLMLFCAGIPTFLFCCGLMLIYRWLNRKVTTLEISEAGVRYGTRFDTWDRIKRISWRHVANSGPAIFYQTKGFSFDRNLLTTDPLAEEDIMALFTKLEAAVVPFHEDLKVIRHCQATLR